ncbi:iron chaperone [Roseibium sp. MMSF_3544]|uniref:iron chaperone n=1 Tax=unclassified Roseibium TaxID=2629323 RepID=UPI00273FA3F0|nr:DUF1801 domain-containing protein [Roseibium sp. MMSF_3544]
MQYEAASPEEYLAQLETDWRRDSLMQIREIILSAAPDMEECIHYKMLGYTLDGSYVFHLNAQRNYVSLYVGDASRIDPKSELLKGLSVGKGCIRFSKTKSVAESRIGDFIGRAVELARQGVDIDC